MMALKVLIISMIKYRKKTLMLLQISIMKVREEDLVLYLNGMIMMNLKNF